jgi:hypothetical protein
MVNNVVISRSCRRSNDAIEMRSTICESLAGKRQARTAIWEGRAAKLDTVNRILPTQATVSLQAFRLRIRHRRSIARGTDDSTPSAARADVYSNPFVSRRFAKATRMARDQAIASLT